LFFDKLDNSSVLEINSSIPVDTFLISRSTSVKPYGEMTPGSVFLFIVEISDSNSLKRFSMFSGILIPLKEFFKVFKDFSNFSV
jgi:hypothetical protein